MANQVLTISRFATFTWIALSIALALAIPQIIIAAAPPAPGTAQAFLVWF